MAPTVSYARMFSGEDHCPLCQDRLQENAIVAVTACRHIYNSTCLAKQAAHVQHTQNTASLQCALCRTPLALADVERPADLALDTGYRFLRSIQIQESQQVERCRLEGRIEGFSHRLRLARRELFLERATELEMTTSLTNTLYTRNAATTMIPEECLLLEVRKGSLVLFIWVAKRDTVKDIGRAWITATTSIDEDAGGAFAVHSDSFKGS